MRLRSLACLLLLLTTACAAGGFTLNPYNLVADTVALPPVPGLIFHDMTYDASLGRVLIPGGRSGVLFLLDPQNPQSLKTIPGGNASPGEGIISASAGLGHLFLLNQSLPALLVANPDSGEIVAQAPLSGAPELVRFIPPNQLWVTQPGLQRIDVFTFRSGSPPTLTLGQPIPVEQGPRGLLVDESRGLVYTHQPNKGLTSAIQILTHRTVRVFGNGCTDPRGMALDREHGYLLIGCSEGKLVLLDILSGGVQMASVTFGAELDQIAYDAARGHIYLPSGKSAILGVFAVGPATPSPTAAAGGHIHDGALVLTQLGSADTRLGSNCVTVSQDGNVWLCDPANGRLLRVVDTFSSTLNQ